MPTGHIQNAQTITGHISKGKTITGTIAKPSSHEKSDHVFVTVDLLKLYASQTNTVNANVTADMSATNTRSVGGQLGINLTSTDITVVQAVVTE